MLRRLAERALDPLLGQGRCAARLHDDEAGQIVDVLPLNELDRKAGFKDPDDASHAGADRQRRSERQLNFGRDAGAGRRYVDDEAAMHAAVGEYHHRVGRGRDDAGIDPRVLNARIRELSFEPGELLGEPRATLRRHLHVDQEAAAYRMADGAFELAELAEIGGVALADAADDRHLDHHAKRRDAAGPTGKAAQLPIGIIPAPLERIAAVDGDIDRALLEEGFDGHRNPIGADAPQAKLVYRV